jgi:hypothetical protein
MKAHTIQSRAALGARIAANPELKKAIGAARRAIERFSLSLANDAETLISFSQAETKTGDETAALLALAKMFDGWAFAIGEIHTASRAACRQGETALQSEIRAASDRVLRIAEAIPMLVQRALTPDYDVLVEQRKLIDAGLSAGEALRLRPGPDREDIQGQIAALQLETAALSRFLRSYSLSDLPDGFADYLAQWKLDNRVAEAA